MIFRRCNAALLAVLFLLNSCGAPGGHGSKSLGAANMPAVDSTPVDTGTGSGSGGHGGDDAVYETFFQALQHALDTIQQTDSHIFRLFAPNQADIAIFYEKYRPRVLNALENIIKNQKLHPSALELYDDNQPVVAKAHWGDDLSGKDDMIEISNPIIKKVGGLREDQAFATAVHEAFHLAAREESIVPKFHQLLPKIAVVIWQIYRQTPSNKPADNTAYTKVIELFLKQKDVDVNTVDADGKTFLHYVAQSNNPAALKLLLENPKVNVNLEVTGSHMRALHYAAKTGNPAMIRPFFEREQKGVKMESPELEAPDDDGNTALHWAVSSRNADAVKLLLDYGAKVNKETGLYHFSQLHFAVRIGNYYMVKYLLDAGADVNARDLYELTPLHYAAIFGSAQITKLLLAQKNVEVNPTTKTLNTPLHFAAISGDPAVIKLLLSKGASNKFLAHLDPEFPTLAFLTNPDIEKKFNLIVTGLTKKDQENYFSPFDYSGMAGNALAQKILNDGDK